MAVTKVLARGWKFEVETAVPATYVEIGGINSFSISRDKADADGTDFKSMGSREHIVASRGTEFSFEGYYMEDMATKARDGGQERFEAVADLIGPPSIVGFKITSPGGKLWTFKASANVGDVGGGNDDNTTWGGTITVSGAVTKA